MKFPLIFSVHLIAHVARKGKTFSANEIAHKWNWPQMGLTANFITHRWDWPQNCITHKWDWLQIGLLANRTDRICDCSQMGLTVNGTACKWDWPQMGLTANGTACKWDWPQIRLLANGTARKWDDTVYLIRPGSPCLWILYRSQLLQGVYSCPYRVWGICCNNASSWIQGLRNGRLKYWIIHPETSMADTCERSPCLVLFTANSHWVWRQSVHVYSHQLRRQMSLDPVKDVADPCYHIACAFPERLELGWLSSRLRRAMESDFISFVKLGTILHTVLTTEDLLKLATPEESYRKLLRFCYSRHGYN
jgi:hypothetical protein